MSTTIGTARNNRSVAPAAAPPPHRRLLALGAAAGPIYIAVAAAQVLTRDGFDIRRHPVSLLSNGDLGWIQITSFILTGLLVIAGAVGLHRVLRGGGTTWGPRLIGVYGVSLVAAGLLVADPALGFPAGTPDGAPTVITGHGIGHFVAGGVGFLALVAACLVLGRHFARSGRRGMATYSRATGITFLVAFAGITSGNPALNIPFTIAVVLAWTWISVVCVHAARAPHATAAGQR